MVVGECAAAGSWAARSVLGRRLAVLLVDHSASRGPLVAAMSAEALEVHTADTAADALLLVGRAAPDVVVAGPTGGRLDLVALVGALHRHEPELPVIVGLGPRDGELAAGLAALEPAAVIGYPFRIDYVVRLVRTLVSPDRPAAVGMEPIDLGRLRIDGTMPEIWLDDEQVVLPLREFLLLRHLAEHVGRVVSRSEIGEAVWGSAETGTNNTVAVHVMRLRRRLGGARAGARWIRAVRGVGYQLDVPPREADRR